MPLPLETLQAAAYAALDQYALRRPTWEEWGTLLSDQNLEAVGLVAAALLRERDALDDALERLAVEIPALKPVFEKKTTTLERLQFLCGAFLVSYRLSPKKKLEAGGSSWAKD